MGMLHLLHRVSSTQKVVISPSTPLHRYSSSLILAYDERVTSGGFTRDSHQESALSSLNRLNVEIMNFRFLSEYYINLENNRKIALKECVLNLKEIENDILEPTVYCC